MKSTAFVFLLLPFLAFSQNDTASLKVQGVSKLSVKPTRTVISYQVRSIDMNYAKSVEKLIQRIDLLSSSLVELGFNKDDLVTTNFNVDRNVVFGRGTRKDSGFVALQTLKIDFNQDESRLLEVLNKSVASEADPEITISFEIDSKKQISIQNELIKMAVQDAQKKAELISTTAGYRIIGIKLINYHVVPNRHLDEVFSMVEVMDEEFIDLDIEISNFEASNLTFTDKVDVEYFVTEK